VLLTLARSLKPPLGSVPSACLLVSPLYYKPSVNVNEKQATHINTRQEQIVRRRVERARWEDGEKAEREKRLRKVVGPDIRIKRNTNKNSVLCVLPKSVSLLLLTIY